MVIAVPAVRRVSWVRMLQGERRRNDDAKPQAAETGVAVAQVREGEARSFWPAVKRRGAEFPAVPACKLPEIAVAAPANRGADRV